jgi:hypothetical protein
VYIEPRSYEVYKKTNVFPEGTIFFKELQLQCRHIAGWLVMVKDSVGRCPGNKCWRDGWGWSWFDAPNPQKTTSTDYTTDRQSCHVPARRSDWIYTHGYPVLTR